MWLANGFRIFIPIPLTVKELLMRTSVRRMCVIATALIFGALTASGFALATTTNPRPVTATVTASPLHIVKPAVCRFSCR